MHNISTDLLLGISNPASLSTPTVLAVLVVLWIFLRVTWKSQQPAVPLPPGPTGHWLFGNNIPANDGSYRKFEEWTQAYGPIFSLRQGLQTVIVIGRYQAAVEIMEREGASLIDRPRSIAGGETLSGNMRVLVVGEGTRLKQLRRALHAKLQLKVASTYEPIQIQNAKTLIMDVIRDPGHHQDHARRYAASVIMTLTYGKTTPTSYTDPEVLEVNKCMERFSVSLVPGAYLVDAFPVLRFVPGYVEKLRRWHIDELTLFRSQLAAVDLKRTKGEYIEECFAKYLLENKAQYGLSDDEMAYLAGSMFGAGAETTAAAISIMIMAAASFPDAQAKVQEELDNVVGKERCPTFDDDLPQVTAFYLECYRWRPGVAGGVPHRATKDIIWRDYRIPKGATVIGSHWSIFRDPDIFPDPETFNPRRWITPEGKIRQDLKNFNFGFGRRICVGAHVANRSLFINTALILWAFKISQDPKSPIDTMALRQGAVVQPLPFEVKFEKRGTWVEGGLESG